MLNCWVIGEPPGDAPPAIAQVAAARGETIHYCAGSFEWPRVAGTPALIAIDCPTLEHHGPALRQRLRHLVVSGATLYVRGGFQSGRQYSIAPFANACFSLDTGAGPRHVQFSHHNLLPAVIRGTVVEIDAPIAGAHGLAENVSVLASVMCDDGCPRPLIFALRLGAGLVLYDLNPEAPGDAAVPLLWRLSERRVRNRLIGALAAVDRAMGRYTGQRIAVNLVIDDRPANFDFRIASTRRWLDHARSLFGSVHVDFAWTPDQCHPSPRYIAVLKSANAGFVWHGLHHHVDHRRIHNLTGELIAGRRLVARISRDYQVRFQPIMIFPFERSNPRAIGLLRDSGFLASFEYAEARPEFETHLPAFMRFSTALQPLFSWMLPVLRRYPAQVLTIEMMEALACLGLPIVAAAHPEDLALRRMPDRGRAREAFSYFDRVLEFAATWRLRAMSLEEVAREVIDEHGSRSSIAPAQAQTARALS